MDNYLDLNATFNASSTRLLPDKTVLCNDSCNMFLKESSEILFSHRNFEQQSGQATQLSQHRTEEELIDLNKLFTCTFTGCGEVYAKPAHLKAHHRRHIGDKPYVCTWPECNWKFSRSDELSRQRRSHFGIKPYQCVYCTKCFSRSDHLTKHRKVHERKMATLNQTAGNSKGIFRRPNLPTTGRPGRKPLKASVLV